MKRECELCGRSTETRVIQGVRTSMLHVTEQEWDQAVPTKHSLDCRMTFGRKDPNCPRCQELLAGAAPRAGWQRDYFSRKKAQDDQRRREIAEHFAAGGPHARGVCGPVCTAFDW